MTFEVIEKIYFKFPSEIFPSLSVVNVKVSTKLIPYGLTDN